jgi:glycine/D-amino acid oxidase-like deaminating enzyme
VPPRCVALGDHDANFVGVRAAYELARRCAFAKREATRGSQGNVGGGAGLTLATIGGAFGQQGTRQRVRETPLCMPKTRPFDLMKESRNVGHDDRAALLPFEAVGFAVRADQPA